MDISNPIIYAAPVFIGFIVLEASLSRLFGDKKLYEARDFGASLFIGAGTLVLGSLLKVMVISILFFYVYQFFNPLVDGVRMNIFGYQSFGYAWYVWLACQFLDDFSFYWYHRLSHTIRILWAMHLPHHSSDHFNYGTGIRIGWFVLIYKPIFYLWILAIGFPYEMLLICLGIETIYQFQLHTQYVPKLGFLEKFLVTHSQHQVHHSRHIPHLDMNHGGILCIFDKLFGTFYEYDPSTDKVEYGVLHPPDSFNPFVILTHEFKDIWNDVKNASNPHEAFMYVFGPPGWSVDGSRETSKNLQKRYKNNAYETQ
ncbi:MAG: sterol desaturase family protein [Saprospiraceae bacterium]|nr:sterol desaturase family protein [Saprospiraceae bacterium]MCB9322976.1 sterol desaturase family protein [Lewinellaceae bacterium]